MATPDRFQQLEAEYFVLRGKFVAGRITSEEFSAALKQRLIKDERGAYWTIGAESGKWFRYDGARWQETPTPGSASAIPAPQPMRPPPPMRGSATGQITPLPSVSNTDTARPPSRPVVTPLAPAQSVPPSHPIVQPPARVQTAPAALRVAAAPRAGASVAPSAGSPLMAQLRANGWRGLLPLAFVLLHMLLTRNLTPLVVGVAIAVGVRLLAVPADRVLAPFWPIRDRIPRKPRMLLAWLLPLLVSLVITTTLYNLFAWLPLIGPDASVFTFTAGISAAIAFVLVRDPAQQAAA